jgi:hypothetical protein
LRSRSLHLVRTRYVLRSLISIALTPLISFAILIELHLLWSSK